MSEETKCPKMPREIQRIVASDEHINALNRRRASRGGHFLDIQDQALIRESFLAGYDAALSAPTRAENGDL